MKQLTAPVKKNDDITITIDALTGEGAGVGRVDGYAVFVPGALPGETVTAHVLKVSAGYAVAKCAGVVTASPDRVTPRCPVYARCGGCALQHLKYEKQLEAKRAQVYDALTRLGGIEAPQVEQTIGMETPWRCRNKGSFPFGSDGGEIVFGFYAGRSHRIVPCPYCMIQDERVVDVMRRVAAWANDNAVSAYDEETQRGLLRHVSARVTAAGEVMTVIVTNGPLKKRDELLAALENVDSVWHNRNDRDTNVIFGDAFTLLCGRETLTEQIGGRTFAVSPQSFLQVNAAQAAVLYDTAITYLAPTPEETILDVYCGVGTISLLLADRCAGVIGIEQVPEAIADAERNAAANGVANARFLCGNAEDVLPKLVSAGERIAGIVLDPPRKGCEPGAIAAAAESGAERIVYVSCNPATLARDCRALIERGYTFVKAQPVDMFPQTGHVECVVLLSKVQN